MRQRLKAFLSIKYHADGRNRTTIERVSALLEERGFESICIVRDLEYWGQVSVSPRELMTRTFEAINACDVLVVELTEKGVGVGIEAGYAAAMSIPVVTIARVGADVSETLQGISRSVCYYEDYDQLAGCFGKLLDELLVTNISRGLPET